MVQHLLTLMKKNELSQNCQNGHGTANATNFSITTDWLVSKKAIPWQEDDSRKVLGSNPGAVTEFLLDEISLQEKLA